VAKRKTAEADVTLDESGRPVDEEAEEFGDNVLIVDPHAEAAPPATAVAQTEEPAPAKKRKTGTADERG
jgi:hypothetical protein